MLKVDLNTAFLKINFAVIFGLVTLLFCFDFLDKIEIFYGIDFPKFNRFIKAAAVFYAIGFIVFHLSYVMGKLKYLICTTIALSLIFALKYNYWDLYFPEFFRYMFILILYPVLHFSFHYSKHQEFLRLFYLVLKTFMIANLIAIFAGMIFNIEVFHTYQYGRAGYNGFLLSQGLTPYVYMSATVIFWAKKDNWMLVVVLLSSILSGVKGAYLGEFMLILILLYFSQNLSKAYKMRLGAICLAGFLVALTVIFMTPTFRQVIQEDGIVSALFSYRIDNLIEAIETSPDGSFNFLIGGVGLETVRLEMQLVDMMLLFGIIGIIIYGYFMVSVFMDVLKNNQSKAFFIASLSLSLLSGNLFYIPLAILLFFLTIFCLNQELIQNGEKA